MKRIIHYANKYIVENDCKVLGMLQFCIASVALMLGLTIPEKKKKPAFLVACGVFLVAATGVMAHMLVKLAGYRKADAAVEEEWTEEEWAAEEAMWPSDDELTAEDVADDMADDDAADDEDLFDPDVVTDDDFERIE